MLTKRQNLEEVMKGGNPDRFVNQYEAFKILFGVPCNPYRRTIMGGEPSVDGWGVTKIWPEGTPGAFPLEDPEHLVCPDITRWREYVKAPQIDYPDEAWAPLIAQAEAADRNEQFSLVFFTPGIFETLHNLLGMTECLVNFYEEPECMEELIDYITEFQLDMAREVCARVKADGIFIHDDWGTQISTFISPDMFEEFFVPAYKKIYGYYKEHGLGMIVHHSDSYAATLVPHMIEMGINVWQGALSTNDIPSLIEKYGDQITIMGGIDDGKVDRPDWTPELVREVAREAVEKTGKLHYIPSLCQGLPFAIYPGVHDEVTAAIHELSAEMF